MNILAGVLFVLSALITFGAFIIDEEYYIALHVIRAVLSLAALVIIFKLGVAVWMCIVGAISFAIHVFVIFSSIFDWDAPILTVLDFASFFGALAVGIAMFF